MTKPFFSVLDRDTLLAAECKPGTPGAIAFMVRRPYEPMHQKVWVDPMILPNYFKLDRGILRVPE
jgi:hypothetical protein